MLQKTTLHCSSKWTSSSAVFSCLNPELKRDILCLFKNVFILLVFIHLLFSCITHPNYSLSLLLLVPTPSKEQKHVYREPSADHYRHPDGHFRLCESLWALLSWLWAMFFILWAPTILHPPLLWNFWSSTYCLAVWSLSQPFL